MIHERLKLICDKEGVSCEDETLFALVEASGGDMRRAITCLQSCAKLKGSDGFITKDIISDVTGVCYLPKQLVTVFFNQNIQ